MLKSPSPDRTGWFPPKWPEAITYTTSIIALAVEITFSVRSITRGAPRKKSGKTYENWYAYIVE
jgi:hypothetical protein